jgi:two-component system response regulator PilR (NtrC family)
MPARGYSQRVGKILVVDDEQSMREFLGICLRRAGHDVVFATAGREALDLLRTTAVDIVVTDLRMPGELDGLGLLAAIKTDKDRATANDPDVITGESGTGKELVARALHTEGARAKAPFVAVNCAAIPAELLESELFGHKRGAFTGAVADRTGVFEQADAGSLFLDEIGEMPLGLQVKLLRALQERRVKPVGGTDEINFDVRVIAATNRDLEAEVARGAMREDLYYRLKVIEIQLPPLRHRREDIPLLADHFLRRFGVEHGRTMRLKADALRVLEAYDYPGNVRELENLIERAVALAPRDDIGVADLPPLTASRAQPVASVELPPEGVNLDQLVTDFERVYVLRALERANNIRARAAKLLGISLRSLRYRLEKLGIEKLGDDTE